jgi:hypothetical protein
VLVEAPAAVALGKMIGVEALDGRLAHAHWAILVRTVDTSCGAWGLARSGGAESKNVTRRIKRNAMQTLKH